MLGAVFGFPCVTSVFADIPGPIRECPNSIWDFPAVIGEFPSPSRELPDSICAIPSCLWEALSTIIGSKREFIQANLLGMTPYFAGFAAAG